MDINKSVTKDLDKRIVKNIVGEAVVIPNLNSYFSSRNYKVKR